MDDLLADFVAETREMLEAIEGEVVAWEADPSDRARLDAIFRFVHTVKGNCGFFDFPRLERLSHAAEGALADVRSGHRPAGAHLVNGVLAIIDRIAEMVDAIEAGEELPGGSDERLISALEPEFEESSLSLQESPSATSASKASSSQSARTVRLPVELLDRLMSGVSDMVLARNELARRLREAGNQPTIDGPFERLSSILDDVRGGVTQMRMQPIEHLFSALPRLVRDLSGELGKQVMVDFDGGDVELDREMMASIRDPITHIIRNAIDHGIETPSERMARGKREIGLLSMSARQSGNRITLVIADDGRGLDLGKVTYKAVANGVATQDEIDAMTRQEKLALIFAPGLSTAEEVNAISGRGVGMDVVRANLEQVGGTIAIDSHAGEGTTVSLQLPLTLSIIAGLTVRAGERRFALPRSYIEEIARGASAALEIERLGDGCFVTFRGARVACLELAQVLGLEAAVPLEENTFVFVRLAGGDPFAIAVDRVLDNEDLVVKPLAPAVMATGLYAGSTLLDDGHPTLLLDIPNIAAANGLANKGRKRVADLDNAESHAAVETAQAVLFTDLDGKRRAIRMQAVNRIEQVDCTAITAEGDHFQAAIDGAILPLVGLSGAIPERERIVVLRLGDGTAELLQAVDAIENTADLTGEIVPVPGEDRLEGMVLFDGEPAGLIDVHRLFARHARRSPSKAKLRCRLPQDDDWARTFLAPLIEAAGYKVVWAERDEADISIVADDDTVIDGTAGTVIRLRTTPEAAPGATGSIYRYDREALFAALGQAAGGTQ